MARLLCTRNYAQYDAGDQHLVDDEKEAERLLRTGSFEKVESPTAKEEKPSKPSITLKKT